MRRVVVTGIGAIGPTGSTVTETWEAAKAAKSGIGPITLFDPSDYAARIAGEVKNFDPKDHLHPKEIKKMDRFIQLCLAAGAEAVNGSGLDTEKEDSVRMGSCIGVGIGGLSEIQNQHFAFSPPSPGWDCSTQACGHHNLPVPPTSRWDG